MILSSLQRSECRQIIQRHTHTDPAAMQSQLVSYPTISIDLLLFFRALLQLEAERS
jgi:hypothetical protein